MFPAAPRRLFCLFAPIVLILVAWSADRLWAERHREVLSGYYAVREVAHADGDVLVNVAIKLANHGETDLPGVEVSISSREPVEDGAEPGTLFEFPATDLRVGRTVRLSTQVVIPFDEWARWQHRNDGPRLQARFTDTFGEAATRQLHLTHVGDIPFN